MPLIGRKSHYFANLELYVPGIPVPQPRSKATLRAGHVVVYNPNSRVTASGERVSNGTAEYKALIRQIAAAAYQGAPVAKKIPVRCSIEWVFPRLAEMNSRRHSPGRIRHPVKPDRDNLDKMVLDALTGILWINDACVCSGCLDKYYAAVDEQPHTLIRAFVL